METLIDDSNVNLLRPCFCLLLGCSVAAGTAYAGEMSERIKAATVAGLEDYHKNPFPHVIEKSERPVAVEKAKEDAIDLPSFEVNTTRLPPNRLLVQPKTRNVIESWIPGTGVTVTETKKGSLRTVGRILFIPVFWDLSW